MRWCVAIALLVLAAPAAADIWTWTDAAGEQHFTDDPGGVPPARVHTLRRLDEPGTDGSFSTLGGGTIDSREDQAARTVALEARRRLLDEHGATVAELERLRAELSEATRESRKWKAGGRIGAADRAVEADRRVEALRREVQAREARLAELTAKLELLDRP